MYIARQPIFNKEMKVYGYELLFRSDAMATTFCDSNATVATASVISGLFETGIRKIVDGTKAFINFDYDFILSDTIELIHPNTLVIEVLETVNADMRIAERLVELQKKGYKIALDDFVEDYDEYKLVPISNIIKIDIIETPLCEIGTTILKAKAQHKMLLAEKIETEQEFLQAKKMGFELFQGYFFSKPSIISKVNDKKSTKIIYVRILNELKKEEPSYQTVADIINTDVNLAFRLMRVIQTKQSDEMVDSIKKALLFMGFKEIERWISILMLQELSHQKPEELLKLSLVRTKFSELIALHSIYKKRKSEISMMCLFSVLDAMLDVPMEEALVDIALSEDVKSALIHEGGKLKPICDLMYAYENGEWEQVKQVSNQIKIKEEKVSACYLEAITFANDILSNFN